MCISEQNVETGVGDSMNDFLHFLVKKKFVSMNKVYNCTQKMAVWMIYIILIKANNFLSRKAQHTM